MKKFDFQSYLEQNGFDFANHPYDAAYENNNGFAIYFHFHDQDTVIIYDRASDGAWLTDIPKTEKEAAEFYENNGICFMIDSDEKEAVIDDNNPPF